MGDHGPHGRHRPGEAVEGPGQIDRHSLEGGRHGPSAYDVLCPHGSTAQLDSCWVPFVVSAGHRMIPAIREVVLSPQGVHGMGGPKP